MRQTICDGCGGHVAPEMTAELQLAIVSFGGPERLDLCPNCTTAVRKQLAAIRADVSKGAGR